jgi:hypothetical protein
MASLPEFTGVGDSQITVNDLVQSNVAFFEAQSPAPDFIVSRHTNHLPPSSDIDYDFAPIQFEIKNAGQHFLDFSTNRLMGTFKVIKADGTNLTADDDVAIVNNFPHALWDNIDITIDGNLQVPLSTARYGHKALFEHLFSYNKHCEGHTAPLSLWHIDSPGKYDTAGNENLGYKHRKDLIKLSKECSFNVPLLIDFFSLNKLFPNCKSIVISLNRKRPEFVLMAPDDTKQYKIKFVKLKLKIDKVTLHPQLLEKTELQLLTNNMVFPFDKCKILEFAIKQNQTLVDFNEIINGEIPKYFLMAMIKTSALTGSYTENPWNFPTNNLTKLYCKINGHIIPSYPYEFNFTPTAPNPPDCLEAFASLYDDLGINRAAREHYVTFAQFIGGNFIVPFSFCPDRCFGRNHHPPTVGQVSIHMQFSTGLTAAYSLLLFAVYDDELQIDAARQITFPQAS